MRAPCRCGHPQKCEQQQRRESSVMNVALFLHARAVEVQRFLVLLFQGRRGASTVGRKILRRTSSRNAVPSLLADLGKVDQRTRHGMRVAAATAKVRRALRRKRLRVLSRRSTMPSVRRRLRRRIAAQRGVQRSSLRGSVWLPSHRYTKGRFHHMQIRCALPARSGATNVVGSSVLVPTRSHMKQLHRSVRAALEDAVVCDLSFMLALRISHNGSNELVAAVANAVGLDQELLPRRDGECAMCAVHDSATGAPVPTWIGCGGDGAASCLLALVPDLDCGLALRSRLERIGSSGLVKVDVLGVPSGPCLGRSGRAAALFSCFELFGAAACDHALAAAAWLQRQSASAGESMRIQVWKSSATCPHQSALVIVHSPEREGAPSDAPAGKGHDATVFAFAKASRMLFRRLVAAQRVLPIGVEERRSLRLQCGLPTFPNDFIGHQFGRSCAVRDIVGASRVNGPALLRFAERNGAIHKQRGAHVLEFSERHGVYVVVGIVTTMGQSLLFGERVAICSLFGRQPRHVEPAAGAPPQFLVRAPPPPQRGPQQCRVAPQDILDDPQACCIVKSLQFIGAMTLF